MRRMAEGAEGDLTDFHERQLVHALFAELDATNHGLWAAFEYRYFNNSTWLEGRADICAWAKPSRAWLEVKSTGLNPEGWDNSHLGIWSHDATKLLQVRDEENTQIGWVWLFLFETYRKHAASLGQGTDWTTPQKAGSLAPSFGRVDTDSGRLARSLSELDLFASSSGTVAMASVIPQLPRARYNVWEDRKEYSALLVTVDLTKATTDQVIAGANVVADVPRA
jgi:hypothetical protein